jgi:hypothetical protein
VLYSPCCYKSVTLLFVGAQSFCISGIKSPAYAGLKQFAALTVMSTSSPIMRHHSHPSRSAWQLTLQPDSFNCCRATRLSYCTVARNARRCWYCSWHSNLQMHERSNLRWSTIAERQCRFSQRQQLMIAWRLCRRNQVSFDGRSSADLLLEPDFGQACWTSVEWVPQRRDKGRKGGLQE